MFYFWLALFGFAALGWVIGAVRAGLGILRLPRLARVKPLPDSGLPTVSILIPARDEATRLSLSLPTWLTQDYPRYEVIVANDRSTDATPRLLNQAAQQHQRLKVVHLTERPAGWLGKPHALQAAYDRSTGEWLVFSDADVRYAPDVLRRAVSLASQKGWDHLTLFGLLDLEGFGEKTIVPYFALGFALRVEPWAVSNPRSRRYLGVGSFQLLRRSTYEALGTHRRLALEVVDDMKLGKLAKQAGRSGVVLAQEKLRVRWQEGLGNIVRGTTKNFFASLRFSLFWLAANLLFILVISLLPFLAPLFVDGLPLLLAGIAAGLAVASQMVTAYYVRVSPLYGLTHPLGAVIFSFMLLRSAGVTLWRGGITWRGTFYPLDQLRRGIVE